MDCQIGPVALRALIVGWCGGLHVAKGGEVGTRGVAVSSRRDGLFVPKGSQHGGHCPPIEAHCCVHPSPPNTTQYVYTAHCSHSLSPGHTLHNVSLLGPVTASCQESWTHPSAKAMVLKYPANLLTRIHPRFYQPLCSPFPTTSTAVPWSPLQPSFLGNTFILRPCPLLHNIKSVPSRLCVSLLSFSSHLRMLS